MRIDRFEELHGVTFRWRPFSVRSIMIEMDNIPARKPVKLAYMWRDIERRAAGALCDFPKRPPYPLKNFDLANRIAVVGAAEDWCAGLRARDLQPLVRSRRGSRQRAQRLGEPEGDRPGSRTRAGARASPTKPAAPMTPRPPRRKHSASSARRPSSPAAKSSGATTARGRRALARQGHAAAALTDRGAAAAGAAGAGPSCAEDAELRQHRPPARHVAGDARAEAPSRSTCRKSRPSSCAPGSPPT